MVGAGFAGSLITAIYSSSLQQCSLLVQQFYVLNVDFIHLLLH